MEYTNIQYANLKRLARLSVPEPVKGKKDQHNNTIYDAKQKKILEGKRTRLVYLTPEGDR